MPFDSHFVVPDAAGRRMLMTPDGAAWRLPHWPLAEGPPEREQGFPVAVRAWVRERTGIDTVVLRWRNVEAPDGTRQTVYMLEHRGGEPIVGRWVGCDELGRLTLAEPHHRPILEAWFAGEAGAADDQPWRRVGWFDEAAVWIRQQLGSGDVEFAQWHAKGGCCLLRARTAAGGAYYFKALPPMYAREPLVTRRLAELFPGRVPPVVAVDPDRHWLLTAERAGPRLSEVGDLSAWDAALRGMAELQVASEPLVDELLALGCPDLRLSRLPGLLEELLVEGAPLLLGNAGATAPWSDVSMAPAELAALRAMAPRLIAACAELASYGLPEALEHGDFHPGQVLVTDGGPVYIDWSDSAVSHPFFSLARFLTYSASRPVTAATGARERLRDAYLEPWTVYAPIGRLREAAALAVPLGMLEHALNCCQLDLTRRGVPWERSGGPAMYLRLLLGSRW